MDIQRVIRRHGLTQRQVAERMGVSQSSLSQMISKGVPSRLTKIAAAIGCDVSEFFPQERKYPCTDLPLTCPHCGSKLRIILEER